MVRHHGNNTVLWIYSYGDLCTGPFSNPVVIPTHCEMPCIQSNKQTKGDYYNYFTIHICCCFCSIVCPWDTQSFTWTSVRYLRQSSHQSTHALYLTASQAWHIPLCCLFDFCAANVISSDTKQRL